MNLKVSARPCLNAGSPTCSYRSERSGEGSRMWPTAASTRSQCPPSVWAMRPSMSCVALSETPDSSCSAATLLLRPFS
eukprot:scaffold164840_cov32-Tisochrysis_lutea.AAC.4